MAIIESMVAGSEVYSIDQIFCDLIGQPDDLTVLGRLIRERVLRCTSIPVGAGIALPYARTRLLTNTATQAVGYRYSKAEVLLLDLRQPGKYTDNLFAVTQPKKCQQLMKTLDSINARWGISPAIALLFRRWSNKLPSAASFRRMVAPARPRPSRSARQANTCARVA